MRIARTQEELQDITSDDKIRRNFQNMLDHLMFCILRKKMTLTMIPNHVFFQDSNAILSMLQSLSMSFLKDLERFPKFFFKYDEESYMRYIQDYQEIYVRQKGRKYMLGYNHGYNWCVVSQIKFKALSESLEYAKRMPKYHAFHRRRFDCAN